MGNKDIVLRQPHIIFILILVVALVVYVIVIMTADEQDPPKEHPASPEELLMDFIEWVNEGEYKEAMNLTTYRFHPDFPNEDFEDLPPSGGQKSTYSDLQVKYPSSMNQTDMEIINTTFESIDLEYNITIDDYCLVYFTHTIDWNIYGSSSYQDYHPCVMVDSEWYIYAPPYEEE